MGHLALVAGIPGCGKTTFMQWLAREKGYFHLDMERGGLEKEGFRDAWNKFVGDVSQNEFFNQLKARYSRIVLDWNFNPAALELVRIVQQRGFQLWWFEGDRLAARRSFIKRGTESVDNFDCQVGKQCAAWKSIEPMVGRRLIRTLTARGIFLSHEKIYKRFVERVDESVGT